MGTDAGFDFDYMTVRPDGWLGRLVESVWYARGTVPYARERIAPTGSSVGVFVLGDPIIQIPDNGHGPPLRASSGFLLGPHIRPVVNEPTGETFAVGIVTTPVGCAAVFGVEPAAIRGRVVNLMDAWPTARMLRAHLAAASTPVEMLDLVEAELAACAAAPDARIDRCAAAVAALESEPTRAVAEVAAALGISHGHLDREFTRIVGLTPRTLSTLLRMRRLLASIDVGGHIDWADLASELGWFDQAHLIRDFKRHTGVTPTEYVASQRAVYSPVEPGDAAGFVPEV